jgi:AcrR family transcriptional regulator
MAENAPEKSSRRPGGRNARFREHVLDAVVMLVAEQGIAGFTYDNVAELAGVHRTSVYRNWPDRHQLVSEALLRRTGSHARLEDTGDLRQDLVDFLLAFAGSLSTPMGWAVWHAIHAARQNSELLETVEAVAAPRLEMIRRRLDSAVERGELPAVDAYFVAEMLTGPAYFYVSRGVRPFRTAEAERIVDVVLGGIQRTASQTTGTHGRVAERPAGPA